MLSFCNSKDKIPYTCSTNAVTQVIYRTNYVFFLFNSQNIPPPTPQSTIFSLINQKENFLILIHLLLIFILCTCNIRSVGKSDNEHLNFILESGKRQLLNLIFHCTLMTDAYIKKIKSAFT